MIDLITLGIIAGLLPVYLGIVVALILGKVLPRSWEGALIGVAIGVLVYLFFDLMHESVELTGVSRFRFLAGVPWQSRNEFCRVGGP